MKKKISCALLALLLAGQVMGAVSVEAGETKTTYTAVERLAPQFAEIGGISDDGILTVKKGDKWGFVDVTGKTVLDYKYDYASEMVDGIAVVGYLSAKEPYVHYQTKEEIPYIDLYIVDKTGKETRLPVVDGQFNFHDYVEDENGNHYASLQQTSIDVTIKYGVVQLNDYMIYKYDGTPIFMNQEQLQKAMDVSGGRITITMLQMFNINGISEDGIISVCLRDPTDRSPVYVHIDLDGNLVHAFPVMWQTDYRNKEETYQYTLEEYGICYAHAPEDRYTVVYNQHYENYWNYAEEDIVFTPGYGVMNADGEWVIDPVYTHVRIDYDKTINDGYVSLKNQDGYWGMMNVEGEIVFPFAYYAITPMINGYAVLYKEEDATGVITDANGQAYTITDADGNALDVDALYTTNADNNVRRITTADGVIYLLSSTPDGTVFKTIRNTENLALDGGRSSSGKYWTTKTDAGYGIIEIVIEETEVTPVVEEKAEETKPAETEKVEEETKEEVTEEVAEETTKPTTSKFFPIRNGSAAKSKQTKRTNMSMNGLSAVVRH